MSVWFLQVVCFYVVIEALEAQTKTVTVRSLLLVLSFTGEKSQYAYYAWCGQLNGGGRQ